MAEYEVSNPLAEDLALRSGPGVIFERIDSLEPGIKAKGDFIYTYQSALVTDDQVRSSVDDRWIHITELNGIAIDGWTALIHLGDSYAAATRLPGGELTVTFGVELEGYNPITLTGTLTPT